MAEHPFLQEAQSKGTELCTAHGLLFPKPSNSSHEIARPDCKVEIKGQKTWLFIARTPLNHDGR